MIAIKSRNGFVLPLVLFVTAVGLLFGAGALLLFRYQCQLRIDRQHEIEKVYSVRSALNYLRAETVTEPGELFQYHTGSGRDLGVYIKPAKTFFPSNVINLVDKQIAQRHFVMEWGDLHIPSGMALASCGYNGNLDYEYGADGVTNLCVAITNQYLSLCGLVFNHRAASKESVLMKCWVSIGMDGTGGWLQEDYGRRYCFERRNLIAGDTLRMWLIRAPADETEDSDKHSYSWPPKGNCYPLMMEIQSGRMELYECDGEEPKRRLCHLENDYDNTLVGIQLAHDKASLFYVRSDASASMALINTDLKLRGFIFSNVATLSSTVHDYFSENSKTDSEGKIVQAPEMRTIFEFETNPQNDRQENPIVTKFKVTPGYQYDISLVHPEGVTNLATVAQRMGKYTYNSTSGSQATTANNSLFTVLTYDTHGTDNKGFRKDEREAERRRTGQ